MRIISLIVTCILVFCYEYVLSQQTNCTCIALREQNAQLDSLFELKEYATIQSLLENTTETSTVCRQESWCYTIQLLVSKNLLSEAETVIKKLNATITEKTCSAIKSNYYYQLGEYYYKLDKSDSAMLYLIKSEVLSEKLNNVQAQYNAVSRIAAVFVKMRQPEKTLEYDHRAMRLAKQLGNQKFILQTFSRMQGHYGIWYDITQDSKYLDSIKQIARPNLMLAKQLNRKFELAQTYSVLAGVAYLESEYLKALSFCDSGLHYIDRTKDFRLAHSIMTKKCDIYIELKDYEKSKEFADSSLKYATLEQNILSIAFIYERMYELEKIKGNYAEALSFHEKFIQIRDSIRTEERTTKINELEQKYNKAKNEKTIRELSQAKQIASLRSKIFAAGIVSSVLAIILIIIFYRQKTLRNKQENMEIEQRLNRARMNPHFFFNTLNSLQTLSLQENKDSKVTRYLSKYAKIMRETLESTYKELNTVEQEVDYLTNYLEIQKLRYPDKFEYDIQVSDSIEQDETCIPAMIIQPFIENAIEHGFDMTFSSGKVDISIYKEQEKLIIEIADNGSGYSDNKQSKEYPSRASQIIKDRLLLLNKKYKTDAAFDISNGKNNKGTSVKIILPLIYTNEGFTN
jgi:two-component sensor histidine kinase